MNHEGMIHYVRYEINAMNHTFNPNPHPTHAARATRLTLTEPQLINGRAIRCGPAQPKNVGPATPAPYPGYGAPPPAGYPPAYPGTCSGYELGHGRGRVCDWQW